MKHSDLVKEFVAGKSAGKGSRMFIDKNRLYSFGYHFILAERKEGPFKYWVNSRSYSPTTSKHKSYFLREVDESDCLFVSANYEWNIEDTIKDNLDEIRSLKEKLASARTRKDQIIARITFLEVQNEYLFLLATASKI
jgi:hypothetical protein